MPSPKRPLYGAFSMSAERNLGQFYSYLTLELAHWSLTMRKKTPQAKPETIASEASDTLC